MQSICFGIRHKFAITPMCHSQKPTRGLDPSTEVGCLSFCLHHPAGSDAQQEDFGESKLTAGIPPGISPQPDSIGDSRNRFQISDNLNFFHKRGMEEVDEVYDEFESTP